MGLPLWLTIVNNRTRYWFLFNLLRKVSNIEQIDARRKAILWLRMT